MKAVQVELIILQTIAVLIATTVLTCSRDADAQQTIYNANDRLVRVFPDEINAPAITVRVDGVPMASGDQVRFSDATSVGGPLAEVFVIDRNGYFRMRNPDLDTAVVASRDKFGTSGILPPGVVIQGPSGDEYYLKADVSGMNLITAQAANGILKLEMDGSPANEQNTLSAIQVHWSLTLSSTTPRGSQSPVTDFNVVQMDVTTVFGQEIHLSSAADARAESFKAAVFSSSDVPPDHTSTNERTHDADELRITAPDGTAVPPINLNTASTNTLLMGSTGQATNRRIQLNQVTPAPLNGDPPNITFEVSDGTPTAYRAQAYITLNPNIDENSDNVGAWLNRSFASTTIPAGTILHWSVTMTASDSVFPLLGGDYNKDGVVNAADYLIWRKYQGTSNLLADGNLNGTVDVADHTIWRSHFGLSAPPSAGSGGGAAVPEPGGILLAITALGLFYGPSRHPRIAR